MRAIDGDRGVPYHIFADAGQCMSIIFQCSYLLRTFVSTTSSDGKSAGAQSEQADAFPVGLKTNGDKKKK